MKPTWGLISRFGLFPFAPSLDHVETGYTPNSFFDKYVGSEIDEYVSLINSPTKDKPFMKSYTIDYLGNVIEGKVVTHLNLPMERIKELIVKQLKDGNIVWFGSDVAAYGDRTLGVWDDLSFDYMSAFNMDIKFDKAGMLDYHGGGFKGTCLCFIKNSFVEHFDKFLAKNYPPSRVFKVAISAKAVNFEKIEPLK